jgi:predicted ArsR family transcriptional regulator
MSGFCVAAVLLILWCFAIEGIEHIRKRKIQLDRYELSLRELAEDIVRRAETAREADRRNRRARAGEAGAMSYPNSPGFKTDGTSREAADKMRRPALTLRDRVLDLLSQGYRLTADEIADVLGESILSIRPACSELHRQGLVQRSSVRRKNASGMQAHVWAAAAREARMNQHSPLAADVRIAVEVVERIRMAGIADDDPDFEALVSSECDTLERLRSVVKAMKYAEAMAEGCATHIAGIRERQSRFEAKAEKLKRIVFWALQELRLRRLEGPTFTALVKPGQTKVLVTDEASLPPPRTKTEPTKPHENRAGQNRHQARADVEYAGGDVPGALLSNSEDYLEIRGS